MEYSSDSSDTCESDYAGIVIIGNMSSERDPLDQLDRETQGISSDISNRYRVFNPILHYSPVNRMLTVIMFLPHPHPSPIQPMPSGPGSGAPSFARVNLSSIEHSNNLASVQSLTYVRSQMPPPVLSERAQGPSPKTQLKEPAMQSSLLPQDYISGFPAERDPSNQIGHYYTPQQNKLEKKQKVMPPEIHNMNLEVERVFPNSSNQQQQSPVAQNSNETNVFSPWLQFLRDPMAHPLPNTPRRSPGTIPQSPFFSPYAPEKDQRQESNLLSASNNSRAYGNSAPIHRGLDLSEESEQPSGSPLREYEGRQSQDHFELSPIIFRPQLRPERYEIDVSRQSVGQAGGKGTISISPLWELLQSLRSNQSLSEEESLKIRVLFLKYYKQKYYYDFNGSNDQIDRKARDPVFSEWIIKILIYQRAQKRLETDRTQIQGSIDAFSLYCKSKDQFYKILQQISSLKGMADLWHIGRLAILMQKLELLSFYLSKKQYSRQAFKTLGRIHDLYSQVIEYYSYLAYGEKFYLYVGFIPVKDEVLMSVHAQEFEAKLRQARTWEKDRLSKVPSETMKMACQLVNTIANRSAPQTKRGLMQKQILQYFE